MIQVDDFWRITPSETLVSGSTIMAHVRDIKMSDALKFPGVFTPLICFKWNDFWCMTPSETLVSGSTIMAQVRGVKISDALTFPGIFTTRIEWYLIDFTVRNVSVRFDDYGPSKGHYNFWCTDVSRYLCSTYMLQIEWYLIDFTLRNVSVRFHDYGPS